MHDSVFDLPAFRPVRFTCLLAAAVFLFVSWAHWDAGRAVWDSIDLAVFRALNDSLRDHVWWQHLWAIANNRIMDFISALLMTWLAFRYVMSGGEARINERVCTVLYIALVIALAAFAADNAVDMENRYSPTVVLPDVVFLTEQVQWLQTKDRSYNSFPSDHASVLVMVTLMLWHFAGKRAGKIMLVAVVVFSFPRLIGGAHWFSDMAAGGLPLALAAVAIGIYTPLYRVVIGAMLKLANTRFCTAAIRVGMHHEAPMLVVKGSCMGTADVVPGVSGGTMAYILGIWPRLIEAIKSFDVAWVKRVLTGAWTEALHTAHLAFLVPLLIGVGVAVVAFTKFIPLPALILSHPEVIYGLFFGLIIGSVVLLLQETGRLATRDAAWLVLGASAGWLLVNLVPVETPESAWFVFFCGFVAISAMLLPGISGSFILLILGKYAYILGAIGAFNFAVILPFLLGCVAGVIAFSRAASWLLHHYYRRSVLTITGILVGSLWIIWPFQHRVYETVREKERLISSTPIWPETLTTQGWLGIALMVLGCAAVLLLGRIASTRLHTETQKTGA